MKKIYISIDMEGIWGIQSSNQVVQGAEQYQRSRCLMTQEANMVIEHLKDYEVLMNDAHGTMDNVLIESLVDGAHLISGRYKPYGMMEGIDETFDAAFFIGYHPRASSHVGIFDHSFSGRIVRSITINDQPLGEGGINARLAGHYGVPIALVSGDDSFVQQMRKEIDPNVNGVIVKRTISRHAAEHRSRQSLVIDYKTAIESALNDLTSLPVVTEKPPLVLKIAFNSALMAQKALRYPHTKRIAADTISATCEDMPTLYRAIDAMIALAQ